MKLKYNILLTLSVLFGFAMNSCVDEKLNIDSPEFPREGDTPYYVKLRLETTDDTFTRADQEDKSPGSGFQDASHNEHDISPNAGNIAIFFDDGDKYISWAKLYSVNEVGEKEQEEDEDGNKFTPNTPEPEATYSCRFNGFADRKPAKVLVVVNLDPASEAYKKLTDFPGWDVNDVMKNVWEVSTNVVYDGSYYPAYPEKGPETIGRFVDDKIKDEDGNPTTFFTMANSTYVTGIEPGVNGQVFTGAEVHCAQEIDEDNFFMGEKIGGDNGSGSDNETAQQIAESSEVNKPAVVYLERMVAKFSLDTFAFDPNNYTPADAHNLDVCVYDDHQLKYEDTSWSLQILGWGLNGIESSSYLFKNVPDPQSGGENDWLDHSGEWQSNSTYNKRSYWAKDPHYDNIEEYPWQYDYAKDQYDPEQRKYFDGAFRSYDSQNDKFALLYYPFVDFCPFADVRDDDGKLKVNWKHEFLESKYEFKQSTQIYYKPENTFKPGLKIDPSRGTRAYELAGTHLLVCARMLINGNPYNGHIYRNRTGVTYLDEVSMFEDFWHAVNWKLEGQVYMYYRYYPWDEREGKISQFHRNGNEKDKIGDTFGEDFRAKVGGKFALYYEDNGYYYELTEKKLYALAYSDEVKKTPNTNYRLWRDADAINADGKIIPWIMKWNNNKGTYEALDLYILSMNSDDFILEEDGVINPGENYEIYVKELNEETGEYEYKYDENGKKVTKSVKAKEYIDARKLKFQYRVEKATTDEDNNDNLGGDDNSGNSESNDSNDSKYNGGKWKDFEEAYRDNNDIQSLFYEIWGVADDYYKGMMYYAVPIHVIGKTGDGYVQNKIKNLSGIVNPDFLSADRDNYNYGYFGIVRNNWYKFNVHSISGLGVPVSDPGKPIVPNYINKKDQVKVNMEIMQWHIEDQTVIIK